MQHAQQSLVLTSISAVDIIRHVAIRVFLKRLHSDPSEQDNEWGVTCTSGHAHSLRVSMQLSNHISVWFLVSLCSRLESEPRAWRKCFSHTRLSLQRHPVQPAESEQPGGQQGGQCVWVRVCDKRWMAFMYIRTRCVGGEQDRCSCVCKKREEEDGCECGAMHVWEAEQT